MSEKVRHVYWNVHSTAAQNICKGKKNKKQQQSDDRNQNQFIGITSLFYDISYSYMRNYMHVTFAFRSKWTTEMLIVV